MGLFQVDKCSLNLYKATKILIRYRGLQAPFVYSGKLFKGSKYEDFVSKLKY